MTGGYVWYENQDDERLSMVFMIGFSIVKKVNSYIKITIRPVGFLKGHLMRQTVMLDASFFLLACILIQKNLACMVKLKKK